MNSKPSTVSELVRSIAGLFISVSMIPLLVGAQSGTGGCSVQGTVRDSRGVVVAGLSIELQAEEGAAPRKVITDAKGAYCFTSIAPGKYRMHADAKNRGQASVSAIELGQKDAKQVDLVLSSSNAPEDASKKIEFFDEPQFTVAGVTDASNLGGHGSDAVVQTRNSLATDVARLDADGVGRSGASLRGSHAPPAPGGLRSFEENRRVAKELLSRGAAKEALPYLEQASRLQPGDAGNELDLAAALLHTGQNEAARIKLNRLLATSDNSEGHHLLAESEEKLNNPVAAVRSYQRAAELKPSEANLYDWGAELLLHHAAEPAIQVFDSGVRQFPRSVRMRLALGAAYYARGSNDEAVRHLCAASDLDPQNARPYEFLGKILSVEAGYSPAILARLERFLRISPENPRANYYVAVSLMKGPANTAQNAERVETLLKKSVQLDPQFDQGYLQLGILYADRKRYDRSIEVYKRAIAINPDMEEAHYRLAQVYRQMGEAGKAAEETRIYSLVSRKRVEEVERQRHEIQQFVYSLQNTGAGTKDETKR